MIFLYISNDISLGPNFNITTLCL